MLISVDCKIARPASIRFELTALWLRDAFESVAASGAQWPAETSFTLAAGGPLTLILRPRLFSVHICLLVLMFIFKFELISRSQVDASYIACFAACWVLWRNICCETFDGLMAAANCFVFSSFANVCGETTPT